MSYKGIDVSHYNKPINWEEVKNQINFAILKLGNIGDNTKFWLDDTFESNYNECKRLGIPVGVYVYCYSNEIENARLGGEEVRNYLNYKSLDLPVYIDMEDDEIKVEGKNKLTEIVKAFNNEIEKGGNWAGVYANLDWWKNYLIRDELIPRYTSWIAHIDYTNEQDKYYGQYDMFQYSWKGHIQGCYGNNGEVDMNIMYRDIINEIKGSTPQPAPTKSIEDLAQEVMNGEWGNGEDRINRLTSAGYDYNAVQQRVNEILNTIPKKTIDEIAQEVINGIWGNGEDRKQNLINAGYDYNTVQNKVNEILQPQVNYYPPCNSNYMSIVDALYSIGVDASYSNRKIIANYNGIHDYTGTATQNNQLLVKLKAGRLKMP